MGEIENFVAWEFASQQIYKHLVKLNLVTPRKRIAKKDDRWLLFAEIVMFDISESLAIVRQPYAVVLCNELSFTARHPPPPERGIVHGKVSMLRVIYFGRTEVGKRIQQAITYLNNEKAENQRRK